MFNRKTETKVWVIREVEVSTYGSFTTMNESITVCSTEEVAVETIEADASVFEEVHKTLRDGAYKTIRIADDPKCKILIARAFDCPPIVIAEKRLFVEERTAV